MSLSTPVIDELARLLGVEVPKPLREALLRIEGAERGAVTSPAVRRDGAAPAAERPLSKAAMRTRKWRAKKSGLASPTITESVTVPSPTVTPVTVVTVEPKRESFPHTPFKEKIQKTKTKRRFSQRHAVMVFDPNLPRRDVFVETDTALYRELLICENARRTVAGLAARQSFPSGGSGGWWFTRDEVEAAQRAVSGRVTKMIPVRQGAAALHATGPPVAGTG